ncbi:MAG TPA: Pycsar system effector family protein, partial [Mesorhizobium sp.]|nr:Pycsar system effector family protein [Mesorhizobium sp.]
MTAPSPQSNPAQHFGADAANVSSLGAHSGASPAEQAPSDADVNFGSPEGGELAPEGEGDEKVFLDHLKRINDIFYDQIRIADQKAAYIFTFMVAFLVTSAEGRDVFRIERYLTGDFMSGLLSGVLALGVLFTLIFAILVVLPRHRATGTSLYWGGWPQNRALLLAAREHGDPEWVFQEYLGNVDNLSAINRAKYRYVSWSFRGLLVTVVAYCLLLAWGTAAG